jgi:hypothetical protein
MLVVVATGGGRGQRQRQLNKSENNPFFFLFFFWGVLALADFFDFFVWVNRAFCVWLWVQALHCRVF